VGEVILRVWRGWTRPELADSYLMRFQDLDSVRAFAGEDYETAFVPPAAREVLPRYEERSSHYAIVEERPAPAS
jgi:hypothetical protein